MRNRARSLIQANKDKDKKLKLEPHLAQDMRRILRHILNDFKNHYSPGNLHQIVSKYIPDITSSLRSHYRKTYKTFSGSVYDFVFYDRKDKTKESIIRKTLKKIVPYILELSEKHAKIIVNTTSKDLEQQIHSVVAEHVTSGKPLNSQKITDLVFANYSKRVQGRAKIISITETQGMAEKTKQTESEVIQDETNIKLKKTWIAILDDVTREWHADADGQEVNIDEPYIVMGEALDAPGDPNGSPENIINCRCSSITNPS